MSLKLKLMIFMQKLKTYDSGMIDYVALMVADTKYM